MLYSLAEKLGKRIPEIMDMTVEEYAGWIAYRRVIDKMRRKAGT